MDEPDMVRGGVMVEWLVIGLIGFLVVLMFTIE